MRRFAGLSLLLVLLCARAAFASEGHGEGGGLSHLVPYWINFLLYVGLLYYLLKKIVVDFWQARRSGIADAIDESLSQLAKAEAKLVESRERLRNVEREVMQLQTGIERDGQGEAAEIVAEAHRKAGLTVQRAHETCATERVNAEKELRQELAARVVEHARQRLAAGASAESDYARRQNAASTFKSLLH